MTAEQSFFIKILADFINKRKSEPVCNTDYGKLCTIAQNHQMSGILYYQCKDFLPPEYSAEFFEQYAYNIIRSTSREELLSKITEAFTKENIPFCPVKGVEIERFYPVKELRTMGDCDITVSPENFQKAADIFLSLGYTVTESGLNGWVFVKDGLQFELHYALLYEDSANTEKDMAFAGKCFDKIISKNETARKELDINYHFVYLLLHLKKHLLKRGAGFRQFADLAVCTLYAPLSYGEINAYLDELGLKAYAATVMSFCEKWFGISSPLAGKTDEEFFISSTETIFKNGVFGFENEDTRQNKFMNDNKEAKSVSLSYRISLISAYVFPKYSDMKKVPAYSFINGKPYLLPAAWVYRFFSKAGKKKTANTRRTVERAFVTKSDFEKREEYLKKWGL